jgi:hypothetical protein
MRGYGGSTTGPDKAWGWAVVEAVAVEFMNEAGSGCCKRFKSACRSTSVGNVADKSGKPKRCKNSATDTRGDTNVCADALAVWVVVVMAVVAVVVAVAVVAEAAVPGPIGNNRGGASSGESGGKWVASTEEESDEVHAVKTGRAVRGEVVEADDEAADIKPDGVVVVGVVVMAMIELPDTLVFVFGSATDDCGINERHSDGNPVNALSVSSHSTCTNRLTSMGREITPCSATGCQSGGNPCNS